MWKITYLLFVFGATISLTNAAITDEERGNFFKHIKPLAIQCAKELEMDETFIDKHIAKMDPCFVKCVFGETGLLKDGFIDTKPMEHGMKDFIHDEDTIEQLTVIVRACAMEVNEVDLSGDDTDCQRVDLFTGCLKEKDGTEGLIL